MQGVNRLRGARNKANGQDFEKIIEQACEYYSDRGVAEIEKTPEPMKVIGSQGGGKFTSVYEKKAQPDFKGTLKGGRSIVLEAKVTTTGKLEQSVVTEEQGKRLDRHERAGAACYVLVSFGFILFYRIPWAVFKRMKELFGRKYIIPSDNLAEYAVKRNQGVLRFLDNIKYDDFCVDFNPAMEDKTK